MFASEIDPTECRACRVCTACSITDPAPIHSLCAPVACVQSNRKHACSCTADHPKERTR